METARKKLRKKLDRQSFLAALAVLYWHAGNHAHFGLSEDSLAFRAEQGAIGLMMWAVPFFFGVSAYWFFRDFSLDQLLGKWKRRIKSLLIPYLLWNSLYYLYYAVFLRLGPVQRILMTAPAPLTLAEALKGIFLHEYLGVMWYIKLLMVFVLLAPLFYYAFRHRYLGGGLLAVLGILYALGLPFPENPISLNWESLFFYSAGVYLALCFPALPEKNIAPSTKWAARGGVILLVLLSACIGKPPAYTLLMSVLLFLSLPEPGGKEPFVFTTAFFLYAAHMMLMQLPEKALTLLLPHNDAGALITYGLAPLFTVGLAVGIAWALYRYLPGPYGLLTGGRGNRRDMQVTK